VDQVFDLFVKLHAPDDILDIHIEASIISLAVAEAGMINLLKFDATSIYLPQIFH